MLEDYYREGGAARLAAAGGVAESMVEVRPRPAAWVG